MPAGDPAAQGGRATTRAPSARLELCRLAVAGDERFAVSRLELDREGRSYTVDTLRTLHDEQPAGRADLHRGRRHGPQPAEWREPEAVLELATLAVAERAGRRARGRSASSCASSTGAASERVRFFDMPRIDVSSSLVRERVASGRPIRYLVPDAVADAIAEHGWYRA